MFDFIKNKTREKEMEKFFVLGFLSYLLEKKFIARKEYQDIKDSYLSINNRVDIAAYKCDVCMEERNND